MLTYFRTDNAGFVLFGEVARNICGQQAQYCSRYVDGALDGYPNLGYGLRFLGAAHDYHTLRIHCDDVVELVLRVFAYRSVRENVTWADLSKALTTHFERLIVVDGLASFEGQEAVPFFKTSFDQLSRWFVEMSSRPDRLAAINRCVQIRQEGLAALAAAHSAS